MKVSELMGDLRGLPVEDLRQRAKDLDERIFRLRMQQSMGQAESGHKRRPLRRELARVRTVLREKGVRD